MQQGKLSTVEKALSINLERDIYGAFSEIGAGQEVARHFFQAGKASQTIAKTMSAYDMTVSDSIYGQEVNKRYVCQPRLLKMLDHEYTLLKKRLGDQRGDETRFFVFADTVAGKTQNNQTGHGWLGVRFQTRPGGPANDLVLHVKLKDARRLHQQEALGILGVNMLYIAFHLLDSPDKIVPTLFEKIEIDRIEIDMIRFEGEDVTHINNRILSLDLIHHGLTPAILYSSQGDVLQPSDEMFRRPVFVQRGTFRPVTNINLTIQERGMKQFLKEPGMDEEKPLVFMEMTIQHLDKVRGEIDRKDFLERVHTLGELDQEVLISDCSSYFDLKTFLRQHTNKLIGIVIGADSLDKIFDEKYYTDLDGGIMQAMGRLFDGQTRLYVFPFKTKTQCLTAATFTPEGPLKNLYKYICDMNYVVDIGDCDDLDPSDHNSDVRALLRDGDPGWEEHVPEKVRDVIRKNGFFGQKK